MKSRTSGTRASVRAVTMALAAARPEGCGCSDMTVSYHSREIRSNGSFIFRVTVRLRWLVGALQGIDMGVDHY